MTTLSHLYIHTDATELAITFKLSDWIGVINWTHLLQSERHAGYFDIFVCSRVFTVKNNSLIYCSTLSVFTPLSFQVRSQINLNFN